MSNLTTLTDEQMDLIKSTVAKGATDNELKLFLYRCKEIGLDPLKPGQIFFIKYGSGPGTIVIGRDGFRARAAAIGLHTGTKVGIIRDDKGFCLGAWCEVYRKDWKEPAREEVSLKEYDTGKGQWAKMPETMIKKVAEVAALRMAFPDQLSGLYSTDEMDQATPAIKDAKHVHPPELGRGPGPSPMIGNDQLESSAIAQAQRDLVTTTVRLPVMTLSDLKKEDGIDLQRALQEDKARMNIKPAFTPPPGVPTEYSPGDYVAQIGQPLGKILHHKLKDIGVEQLIQCLKDIRAKSVSYQSQDLVQEFIVHAEDYINEQKDADNGE